MTFPAPGIYDGIPFADYRDLDACSSSRLRDMGRSPAYCRWRMENEAPQTEAMVRGSLVDCLLLEPGAVEERFVAAGTCSAVTKNGGVCGNGGALLHDGAWYCRVRGHAPAGAAPSSAQVLDAETYARGRTIADAVRRHPFWRSLSDMRTQVTAVSAGNPGRKVRPDILAMYGGERVLVDLKVCRHASQDVYPRACWGLWHPHQLIWYSDTLALVGERVDSCWILAVHPEPPHEVTAYMMSPALLIAAREVVLAREARYADCVASGEWPDGDEIVVVEAPAWVLPDEVTVEEES